MQRLVEDKISEYKYHYKIKKLQSKGQARNNNAIKLGIFFNSIFEKKILHWSTRYKRWRPSFVGFWVKTIRVIFSIAHVLFRKIKCTKAMFYDGFLVTPDSPQFLLLPYHIGADYISSLCVGLFAEFAAVYFITQKIICR